MKLFTSHLKETLFVNKHNFGTNDCLKTYLLEHILKIFFKINAYIDPRQILKK